MKKLIWLCLALLISFVVIVEAEVPTIINYQGRLTDIDGEPENGDFSIVFSLYDQSEDGNLLWQEDHITVHGTGVTVDTGLFNVLLGGITPFPDSIFKIHELWLEIKIESDPALSPRMALTSTAFAYHALRSDSSGYSSSIADNSVTSAKIEDGSIEFIDLGQNGAGDGQVMKWNVGLSSWEPADDIGSVSGWVDDGNVIRLAVNNDSVGIGTQSPNSKLEVTGMIHSTEDGFKFPDGTVQSSAAAPSAEYYFPIIVHKKGGGPASALPDGTWFSADTVSVTVPVAGTIKFDAIMAFVSNDAYGFRFGWSLSESSQPSSVDMVEQYSPFEAMIITNDKTISAGAPGTYTAYFNMFKQYGDLYIQNRSVTAIFYPDPPTK